MTKMTSLLGEKGIEGEVYGLQGSKTCLNDPLWFPGAK